MKLSREEKTEILKSKENLRTTRKIMYTNNEKNEREAKPNQKIGKRGKTERQQNKIRLHETED